MNVQILPCRWPLKENEWPLSMHEGILNSGDRSTIVHAYRNKYDASVVWGIRRRWSGYVLDQGKPVIVVERGYLGERKKTWLSVGNGGLNGLADFNNENVSDDRWQKYWATDVKPWKKGGRIALIMGQVPKDSSLYGQCPYAWAKAIYPAAVDKFKKVFFRPHPEAPPPPDFGIPIMTGDLLDAFDLAKVVITYSSNSAVDAVMNGIPAMSFHRGTMAWDVTSHDFTEPLYKGDRDSWGAKLAYAQWHIDEIKSGEAWQHIRTTIKEDA
jgi:hypothetical protein